MSFQASSSAHLSEIITKIVKVLSPNIHLLFWGDCFRFCSYCFGKTGVWSFGIGHFTGTMDELSGLASVSRQRTILEAQDHLLLDSFPCPSYLSQQWGQGSSSFIFIIINIKLSMQSAPPRLRMASCRQTPGENQSISFGYPPCCMFINNGVLSLIYSLFLGPCLPLSDCTRMVDIILFS